MREGPELTLDRPVRSSQWSQRLGCVLRGHLTLSWGEECWKQMEWCLQRPGGKNDHEIFSSWLSISGEYGERQEVVKKSPERRAESE